MPGNERFNKLVEKPICGAGVAPMVHTISYRRYAFDYTAETPVPQC
jgi:hypothetical protein